MAIRETVATALRSLADSLARVTPAPVGSIEDGMESGATAGAPLDLAWATLSEQQQGALELWRRNPLARRIIGLTTASVVGDGIQLTSDYGPLSRFVRSFVADEQNLLDLAQATWCDELSRSGELFVSLHMNRANGMSYVRLIPATSIDRVDTPPGDYQAEQAYHEMVAMGDPDYERGGRTWLAAASPDADQPSGDGEIRPVMLHFAVNRPAGCVRGESDLAPAITWLKRYTHWLDDRVTLNALVRSFVWQVRVPSNLVAVRSEQYRNPPSAGAVMVVDRNNEEWEAVAPNLQARDAESDGRALRWMIAAGGPGTSLVDFGEAETSNLASARAMAEQRARWMRARQSYFGYTLAQTALTAYNRAVRLGRVRGGERELSDIRVVAPDIAPGDNSELASAASSLADALETLRDAGVGGEKWRRMAVRLVLKFAGERITDEELDAILRET